MKKLYHLCFTSHSEVMFRETEDIGTFINILAIVAFNTRSSIFMDAEMSTHCHLCLATDNPSDFVKRIRTRYTAYFNRKYSRKGPLGEDGFFFLPLEGKNHILTAFSYVLRNGLHHGQSATAYGYPHCSVNDIFSKDLGKMEEKPVISGRNEIASCLSRYSEFPDNYVMNENGVFLRSCFEEIELVESYYATPRAFDFYMNRLSSEEWLKEQEADRTGGPLITLSSLEMLANEKALEIMQKAEKGQTYNASKPDDLAVCTIIRDHFLPRHHVSSIYCLSEDKRRRIGNALYNELHIGISQISRTLAISAR